MDGLPERLLPEIGTLHFADPFEETFRAYLELDPRFRAPDNEWVEEVAFWHTGLVDASRHGADGGPKIEVAPNELQLPVTLQERLARVAPAWQWHVDYTYPVRLEGSESVWVSLTATTCHQRLPDQSPYAFFDLLAEALAGKTDLVRRDPKSI